MNNKFYNLNAIKINVNKYYKKIFNDLKMY